MCLQHEIYLVELPAMGNSHVQKGKRPVLIITNNMANKYSPVIHIAPITSILGKNQLPTHVILTGFGLLKTSVLLVEQLQLFNKNDLGKRIGLVNDKCTIEKINRAISIQLGLTA